MLFRSLTDIQLLAEKLREGQKLEERIEYYEPALGDVLYYKKPLLDILLLKTKVVTTVNFLIPDNTTINGSVYVLKRDFDVNTEYDYNPLAYTADDFEIKTEIVPEELYKSFFRTATGKYIRIYPKQKNSSGSLSYTYGGHTHTAGQRGTRWESSITRDTNGTPINNPIERVSSTDEDNIETVKYKVISDNYDLSSLYFHPKKDGKLKVKDLRGEIITKSEIVTGMIDKYGLYDVVAEVSTQQKGEFTYVNFEATLRELFEEAGSSNTFIPLIKRSYNHWFRDVYFYMNQGEEYVVEDKDYFLLTGEKWTKYDISGEEGKKILTPETESVKDSQWSAYEIKESDTIGSLGEPLVSQDRKSVV